MSLTADDHLKAATITAKIIACILCGVLIALLYQWLFGKMLASFIALPISGGLLCGAFFAPISARRNFLISLAVFAVGSLVLGGMVRIERSTYYHIFNLLAGLFCLVVMVGIVIAIAIAAVNESATAAEQPSRIPSRTPQPYRIPQVTEPPQPPLESAVNSPVKAPLEPPKKKTKKTRRMWSYSVRHRIWLAYEKKCYICHTELKDFTGTYMHLDHIQPLARGGRDVEDNLAACCVQCNQEKHDKDHPELYS